MKKASSTMNVMKKIHCGKCLKISRRAFPWALSIVCTTHISLDNAVASNFNNRENTPQLIAQANAQTLTEARLKERATQEVRETTKQIKAGQSSWKIYYRRASALSALVRYEEALEDLEKSIKLDPKQVDSLLLHARLSENILDDEAAAEDYTKVINLAPAKNSNY